MADAAVNNYFNSIPETGRIKVVLLSVLILALREAVYLKYRERSVHRRGSSCEVQSLFRITAAAIADPTRNFNGWGLSRNRWPL
jgi:hypothetical protein